MTNIINSLADLAEVDTTGFEPKTFESLPIGVFGFITEEPVLTEIDPKEPGGSPRYRISIPHRVIDVSTLAQKVVDPSTLIGKVHDVSFVIDTGKADPFGFLIAYAQSVNVSTDGKIGEWLPMLANLTVIAKTRHRKNPNDPSNPYVDLRDISVVTDRKK